MTQNRPTIVDTPLRILMINLHSSRNAGDAALTLTAIQQLHHALPRSTITLVMNDPTSHTGAETTLGSFPYWIHPIGKDGTPTWNGWLLLWLPLLTLVVALIYRFSGSQKALILVPPAQRALVGAFLDADIITSAPGNVLYSSGTLGISLLLAVFTMGVALVAGKPLYLLPQSIGPLNRMWERTLIRWVITHAAMVMVREPESFALLQRIGVRHTHLYLIPDLAFAFRGDSPPHARAWFAQHGIEIKRGASGATPSPLLGITAINWAAQQRGFMVDQQTTYEEALAKAIRFFVTTYGGTAVLFPQVCGPATQGDDRIPARRIANHLADLVAQHRVIVIEEPVAPHMLQAVYGYMDLFVGTRMHSNIFALTAGVPVIAISYRSKTRGIMHMMHMPHTLLDIHHITASQLIERIETTWKTRDTIRETITQRVALLAHQSQQAATLIAFHWRATQQCT